MNLRESCYGPSCYVLIGEVPYPCRMLKMEDIPHDMHAAELLEDVGKKGEITSDEASTFFGIGTAMFLRWDGDVHPSTGERCYRMVPAPGLEGKKVQPMTDEDVQRMEEDLQRRREV